MDTVSETRINFISENSRIEGEIRLDHLTRVHGTLVGTVHCQKGSMLILGESAVVEGDIHADTLIVDGYVRGNIDATKKVSISSSGRVIGNISAPDIDIQFGAHLEGSTRMSEPDAPRTPTH